MRFLSEDAPFRPGYTREYSPSGGFIEYPADIQPFINWKYIDGPLLYTSDCGLEWLSLWDRIRFALRLIDIHDLDRKHRRASVGGSKRTP